MQQVTGQQVHIDEDVKAVLAFMQDRIAAARVISVAEVLPSMARLLWAGIPQESCQPISLVLPKTGLESR
jgi:hypothetical protein